MGYLEEFYTALRAAVLAAWPEVGPDGIWECERLEQIPFSEVNLPMSVLLTGQVQASEGWGVTNEAYVVEATVFYTAQDDSGDGTLLRCKLEVLRDALLSTGISLGQVLEVTGLDWSESSEPNATFVDKDYPQRAGRLTVHCLTGELQP